MVMTDFLVVRKSRHALQLRSRLIAPARQTVSGFDSRTPVKPTGAVLKICLGIEPDSQKL
jgi:hypothetical protein